MRHSVRSNHSYFKANQELYINRALECADDEHAAALMLVQAHNTRSDLTAR
jgi:hypothetical protein